MNKNSRNSTLVLSAQTLLQVIDHGASLDTALDKCFQSHKDANQPKIQEICYGVCRYYLSLLKIVESYSQKPFRTKDRIVMYLIISSIYQCQFMRTPSYAIVNEAVNATATLKRPWAKAVVNAFLRSWLRENNGSMSTECSQLFPKELTDLIFSQWQERTKIILQHSNAHQPMTLRVNRKKNMREQYAKKLAQQAISHDLTSTSSLGLTLTKPMPVQKIPGFLEGEVSVQDESSQLVSSAMLLEDGLRIIDACAAPGGKTGLLLESEFSFSCFFALDLPHKTAKIEENLTRIDLCATTISQDLRVFSSEYEGELFHRILLDAPCSSTGVIGRHPDIRYRVTKRSVNQSGEKALSLLKSAWSLLRDNGILLYTTCSIISTENDAVIEDFLKDTAFCKCDQLPDLYGEATKYGRQRIPGVHSGDGFYFCRLRKTTSKST